MPRIFGLSFLGCMLVFLTGCAASKSTNWRGGLRETVENIPAERVQFFLYSLDPDKTITGEEPADSTGYFHHFFVLGETQISSKREKRELLHALAKAMPEREGLSFASRLNSIVQAACFNPRHGIRTIEGVKTNDFLICFECGKVLAYSPFGNSSAAITKSQEPVFDRYLNQYKLTKAK